ncbi:hypothetical protein EWM64_g9287 [Hericium alpestre]|uniref:Uncharacterized protein n=1 Tax=Hericium alpestre TaxID=135208 RepID=A0A4Y9ZJG4_9AGAM|nr:hypothetical protein EWM64_g9287 [Hericium alpestre]
MSRGPLPSAPRAMTINLSNQASRIATPVASLPPKPPTPLHSAPAPPRTTPPPVPASPAMPPPPVWKPIPNGNTSTVPTWMQKEESADEKRAVWTERIDLLAQSISERTAYHTSERDVQNTRRVVQGFRFEGAGEAEDARSALASHLQSGESRRVDRGREISALTTKLLETHFWPILPPYDVQDFETKCSEMKDTIGSLRDNVTQLQDLVKKVLWQHLQRQGVSLPGLDPTPSMAVDAGGDSRPAKRQRTSESAEQGLGPSVISGEDMTALPELEKAICDIQERVDKMEASMGDIHNDITQHAQHTIDDIDSKLEAIIDDIEGNASSLTTPEQIAASESARRLREAEVSAKSVEDDMNELVTEVTGLITGSTEAENDRARLHRENEELKQRLAQLEQTEQANKDILTQIRQENDALTKAMALQLNNRPAPPMLPSNEVIMMALEQPIRRTLRSEMVPALDELTGTILEVLQVHGEDVRGPLIQPDSYKQTDCRCHHCVD